MTNHPTQPSIQAALQGGAVPASGISGGFEALSFGCELARSEQLGGSAPAQTTDFAVPPAGTPAPATGSMMWGTAWTVPHAESPDWPAVWDERPGAGKVHSSPHTANRGVFPVKVGHKITLIRAGEIDWLESARNYVELHAGRRVFRVRSTLEQVESRLPADQFIRLSRSCMVRVERIQEIELLASRDCRLRLRDGTKLTLSRRHRAGFERLGLL